MEHVLRFTEHFFWTMVWVILVIIAAAGILHFMNAKGILPGFTAFIGNATNLQQGG